MREIKIYTLQVSEHLVKGKLITCEKEKRENHLTASRTMAVQEPGKNDVMGVQ